MQVVIIADDNEIRDKLADHGFHVQTVAEVAPIEVQPARILSHLYTYLGRNKKLGLTGRKSRDVGILSTSKLYSLKDRIFAFTPQVNNWWEKRFWWKLETQKKKSIKKFCRRAWGVCCPMHRVLMDIAQKMEKKKLPAESSDKKLCEWSHVLCKLWNVRVETNWCCS